MARNLIVADTKELSSDPFVQVSVADFDIGTTVTKQTTAVNKSCCPQWLETLKFSKLMLPGLSARDSRLHSSPGVNLTVFDDDGDGREAELMGRLHVPMHAICQTVWPRWLPLDVPGQGIQAGSILIGFELYGGADEPPAAADDIQIDTTQARVTVFVVGCRHLVDKQDRFSSTVTNETWAEVALSTSASALGLTQPTKVPSGTHPSYLEAVIFDDVPLPLDPLFAPSLTIGICQETRMGGRQVLGSATMDLTQHLERYLDRLKELEKNGETGDGVGPTVVNDTHDKVRARRRVATSRRGRLSFSTGDIITVSSKDTKTHWIGWLDRDPKQLGIFAVDSVTPVFLGPVSLSQKTRGRDHHHEATDLAPPSGITDWMNERAMCMDDLENVFQLSEFQEVKIRAEKQKADTLVQTTQYSELGVLKMYVAITDAKCSGNARESIPLMIGNTMISPPSAVTVRAYVIRGVRLAPTDSNNLADPYLLATLDSTMCSEGGMFWPGSAAEGTYVEGRKGAWSLDCRKPCAGREVEKDIVKNSLNPYFGQCFEWTGVLLPGPATMHIEVWDWDQLSPDDLIGSTTVNLEDRYFSTQV